MKADLRKKLVYYSLFTVVAVLVSYRLFDLDIAVYFHSRSGDSMWYFFEWLTQFGEGGYWILIPWAVYLAYRYLPQSLLASITWVYNNASRKMYSFAYIGLTAFWSGLLVNILKLIFARHRPDDFFEKDLFGITWFDHGYRLASFPSGHSTTAIGVAMALALLFPRYRLPVMIIGVMVLFSRVVLYEHYLSDTIMGAFVGAMSALYLHRKYYLPKLNALKSTV